jgi:hypothetical protein
LFDIPRALVRIAVFAGRHFVLTTPPALGSRMEVVGRKHEPLFDLGVGFLSTI